ncbi:hypothetical protein EQG49_00825 [Periweissella cryptocerci]|uniref:Insertion element IS150 protein InsJ-like helix-turn-helix domain-containing protein n=1 Tax=Periweissella cryptocerci TaxID=2506420 RepID=A0A4P6YR52_9LACO|nr:helix-turn-helix domain-containing protein [Periweissella cryptocerci]QBO35097.1 hypothetical protein EQG49_00825 [Periweissella cryptocerci]
MLTNGLSITETAIKFDIEPSMVIHWQTRFDVGGIDALKAKRGRPNKHMTNPKPQPKSETDKLIQENLELKQRLYVPSLANGKATNKELTQVVESLRHQFKLEDLLEFIGLNRKTFYYNRARLNYDKYSEVKDLIKWLYAGSDETYGYRRIQDELFLFGYVSMMKLSPVLCVQSS